VQEQVRRTEGCEMCDSFAPSRSATGFAEGTPQSSGFLYRQSARLRQRKYCFCSKWNEQPLIRSKPHPFLSKDTANKCRSIHDPRWPASRSCGPMGHERPWTGHPKPVKRPPRRVKLSTPRERTSCWLHGKLQARQKRPSSSPLMDAATCLCRKKIFPLTILCHNCCVSCASQSGDAGCGARGYT
jgi:hypothetical protein